MADFIITSLQSWDIKIGSTIKNTALELSKESRVLYINPPMNHVEWWKASSIKRKGRLQQVSSNLWVLYMSFPVFPLNKIPCNWLFDKVNFINNYIISQAIRKAVAALGFSSYIHLIDTDIYRSQYMKELLNPYLSIYYCRDFVIGVDYWKKNGTRLEPLIAAKADIVLTNSSLFTERFKQYNSNVFTIETGVDLTLYDNQKSHQTIAHMASIQHPIVGFTGVLTALRLNLDLLYEVAQRMNNFNFVFVGPFDEKFDIHPLHQLPNVYYLGPKPIEQLPAFIQEFDVCLNPQIVNDVTDGNYPLKIDEYLAMGKPVVATSTHTMRNVFENYVFLPTGVEEYIRDIQLAATEVNDPIKKKARIEFAHTHSWENSVKKIYNAIEFTEQRK